MKKEKHSKRRGGENERTRDWEEEEEEEAREG